MEAKVKPSVIITINHDESLYLMNFALGIQQEKLTAYDMDLMAEEFRLKVQVLVNKAVALALEKVNP